MLTHLLIVRDIDRPRAFYRRVIVPSWLRRSTAVSCTHADSESPRLAASALIRRGPCVTQRGRLSMDGDARTCLRARSHADVSV